MTRSEDGLTIISDHLKKAMFDSATVIEIDSIIVPSLFGQRSKKKNKRVHQVKTLSMTCVVDQETKDNQQFQKRKRGEKDESTIAAERKECRKAKRARQDK